jgi:NhaP-type Na+/H+ or K+/H+ antiporter
MDHSLNVTALAVVAACLALWGLTSARLARWQVTAPMAFVLLGLMFTHGPIGFLHLQLHSSTIRSAAEVTLALVLFADATRVNARVLAADAAIPGRLLAVALPLTIGAGAALAVGLFGSGGAWVAATIGAIVAPTDAALGAPVMSDERVPARVRRILNVESGLNDGIATPFVNLFLAGALAAESISAGGAAGAALDLAGGAGLGIGVGVVGAVLLRASVRSGWGAASFRPMTVLAVAVLSWALALVTGTNGFVAAFVAGLAFGSMAPEAEDTVGFTEEVGTLLSLLVWFSFGAVMLVPGVEDAGWRELGFAVAALTVVRMVPVAVALAGSGLDRATVAFVGWFGPRGLASVVFGLIAVDSLGHTEAAVVLSTVVVTVGLSVLLHGVTASPLADRYAARSDRMARTRPEHGPAPTVSVRDLRSGRRVGSGGGGP